MKMAPGSPGEPPGGALKLAQNSMEKSLNPNPQTGSLATPTKSPDAGPVNDNALATSPGAGVGKGDPNQVPTRPPTNSAAVGPAISSNGHHARMPLGGGTQACATGG